MKSEHELAIEDSHCHIDELNDNIKEVKSSMRQKRNVVHRSKKAKESIKKVSLNQKSKKSS